MKKIAEKVAIVALVCISFVFVLVALLYSTNVIPQKDNSENSVAIVVLSIFSVLFVGLSVYLLVLSFSQAVNVKRILLFYDVESATRASHKVVYSIVKGCAKEFPQLKVKRAIFRLDDKMGLIANISLESMVAEDIANHIPQFKELLSRSFADALGLKFNSINFDVTKLTQKFTPTDTEVAQAKQTPAVSAEELPEDPTEEPAPVEEQPAEEVEVQPDTKQEDIRAGEDKHPIDA